MNKKLNSAVGLLVIAVLLLAINALAGVVFKSSRVDLTQNRLYTLSDGTKNILSSLQDTVTLRFYFSEKLAVNSPVLNNYARRVRDLLEEYAGASHGKLKLVVADPEPFSDEEDQAVQNRLQGVPIDSAGTLVYFGLVGTGATDEKEVIPFFQLDKEQSLEYDVTRLIYNLTNPTKKPVGIITTLPIEGAQPMPGAPPRGEWAILNVMRQTFSLRFLSTDTDEIPDDIEVLMLVNPRDFSDKTLFAIDQFVLRGGRILAFVDPFSEDEASRDPQGGAGVRASTPKRLFDAWGIEWAEGQVATDIQAATRVNMVNGTQPQSVDYVAWMNLNRSNVVKDDFVAGGLDQIMMATAGALKKKADGVTQVTPLIQTSDKAMLVGVDAFKSGVNPMLLKNNYKAGGEKLMLAARVSGPVKTIFPNGAPFKLEAGKTVLQASKGPANIIVVADTDLLADRFWVDVRNFFGQRVAVPRANNGTFVINALDNLSGSSDLISLRSRGEFSRPFDRVKAIQQEAEQQYLDKEKALSEKLAETDRKLKEIQSQKQASNAVMMTNEQKQELEKFRTEQVKTRKDLRNVQHELRKNIEWLGTQLKIINIGVVPVLVVLIAIVLAVVRHRRVATV